MAASVVTKAPKSINLMTSSSTLSNSSSSSSSSSTTTTTSTSSSAPTASLSSTSSSNHVYVDSSEQSISFPPTPYELTLHEQQNPKTRAWHFTGTPAISESFFSFIGDVVLAPAKDLGSRVVSSVIEGIVGAGLLHDGDGGDDNDSRLEERRKRERKTLMKEQKKKEKEKKENEKLMKKHKKMMKSMMKKEKKAMADVAAVHGYNAMKEEEEEEELREQLKLDLDLLSMPLWESVELMDVSDIITNEYARLITSHLPPRFHDKSWRLIYKTSRDGVSLRTLYSKCEAYGGAVVLCTKERGCSDDLVFGMFSPEPLHNNNSNGGGGIFYGNGECGLFSGDQWYGWTCTNSCFVHGDQDFLAVGGPEFGFWIDESLDHGSSLPCPTFGNSAPLNRGSDQFLVGVLEVWGFE